jgi:dTMP kinase
MNLYGMAVVPDAVFYLNVSSEELVQRNFAKNHTLDYWESGMDLGLSRDLFDSFVQYQALVREQFQRLASTHGFTLVDGQQPVGAVTEELQRKIESLFQGA